MAYVKPFYVSAGKKLFSLVGHVVSHVECIITQLGPRKSVEENVTPSPTALCLCTALVLCGDILENMKSVLRFLSMRAHLSCTHILLTYISHYFMINA